MEKKENNDKQCLVDILNNEINKDSSAKNAENNVLVILEHVSKIEKKIDKHISVVRSLIVSLIYTIFLYTMLYYFSPAHEWGLENIIFYGEITFFLFFMFLSTFGESLKNIYIRLDEITTFGKRGAK